MVITLRMQYAMHYQMRGMRFQRLVLLGRFTLQDIGAQHDIRLRDGTCFMFGVGKGQYIGRIILVAVIAIQGAPLVLINEADGKLCRCKQRCLDPASQLHTRHRVFHARICILHR